MANDLNQFTFSGRLGADPESRSLPSGEPVSNFSVAVGKQWKDKASGERKEQTEWVRCSAFGRLAEICTDYLRKGSQVVGVGELRTRKWQDKSGVDRWTTEIVLEKVQIMGGRADGERQAAPAGARSQNAAQRPAASAALPADIVGDDIPF